MVAVGVAMLIVGDSSIYKSQLATKADSPAHRFRFAMPVLATLPVRTRCAPHVSCSHRR